MTLPGTWTAGYFERCGWLYDPCSLASMRAVLSHRAAWHFEPGGDVFKRVEEAIRWRDGSPLTRVEMEIQSIETQMGSLRMAGGLNPEGAKFVTALAERFKELQKRKAELEAQG